MGFSLKKLVRGAVKLGKKVAPQILKATPAGALLVRAQQAAKGLGVNFRAAAKKQQPVSVQAAIAKPVVSMMASGAPPARRKLRAFGVVRGKPGKRPVSVPSGSRRKAKREGGKGRTPPAGGLDLKAMAAQWRAAGKPGTWLGWIKANPIRKAS